MKAVVIVYYEALDEELGELLEANGVMNYTKWTKVQGRGSGSGAHTLTNVWPKGNNVLFCAMEDDVATSLFPILAELRTKYRSEGVKVFQLPVEVIM